MVDLAVTTGESALGEDRARTERAFSGDHSALRWMLDPVSVA